MMMLNSSAGPSPHLNIEPSIASSHYSDDEEDNHSDRSSTVWGKPGDDLDDASSTLELTDAEQDPTLAFKKYVARRNRSRSRVSAVLQASHGCSQDLCSVLTPCGRRFIPPLRSSACASPWSLWDVRWQHTSSLLLHNAKPSSTILLGMLVKRRTRPRQTQPTVRVDSVMGLHVVAGTQ